MIAVLWPDNSITRATDAGALLTRVGAFQWSPGDKTHTKSLLSDRAWVWSGSLVDPELSDDEFLDALELAGMCLVERHEEEAA